jgi:hypothetical protein
VSQDIISDFRGGVDTRRFFLSAPAGTLTAATDCHITQGGEIEKRKAFSRATGLTGTFGLLALANSLVVFGSGTAASVGFTTDQTLLGQTVSYQRLQHPSQLDGSGTVYDGTKHAMTSVVASTQFSGNAVVAAKFADGKIFGYYNGGLMFDLTDGLVLAHLSTNSLIAAALSAAINRTTDYTATVSTNTVTISGTNGSGYAASASNVTSAGTLTLTKQNEPVPGIVGTVAVGQMSIVKGSYGASAYNQGSVSKVLVNGVDILNATVNWTTSDENTAALIATAINSYTGTSGYTALNSGKLITMSSVALSADLNGTTIGAVTQSALCVDDCGFSFAGTSFIVNKITVGSTNILTLVHPYPSVATASYSLTTNVATITCGAAHGLYTGDSVTISGLGGTGAPLNVTAAVTVTSTTAFTFPLTHANITLASSTAGTVLIDSTLAAYYARLVRDINSTSQNWCAATDGKKLFLTRGQISVAGVNQAGANSISPDDTVTVDTLTTTVAITTDDSGTLTVGLSRSSISGSVGTFGGGAIGPVACNVSGGLAPYAYQWQRVSGSAQITIVSPNSATTLIHIPVIGLDSYGHKLPTQTATFTCLVTDSNGLTAFSKFLGVTAT